MLFDLRSRRRRRVIKTVYLFLALLIGVGLVGFGVGTGGNFGGIFNAASGGGGSAAGQDIALKALTKAQKNAALHQKDPAAWQKVGIAAFNVAQLPTNYVATTNSTSTATTNYTASGIKVLAVARQAWNRYLALSPTKPNFQFAENVSIAFGSPPSGIGDYVTAETGQEVVSEVQPTYAQYEFLAYYAYLAHEVNRGDLAGVRALALAPKSSKKQVAAALKAYRAAGTGSTGSTGTTGATG